MEPTTAGVAAFVVLLLIFGLGMPVGFGMAIVGFVGFSYMVSLEAAGRVLIGDIYGTINSYNLTVLPMFIFMGQIAYHAKISKRLFDFAYTQFGGRAGGLAIATIGACAGFSAICGSTNATAATMASVALPEMKLHNYSDDLAAGTVAAGGSLGILIPPSLILLVYGIMTQQSIGKLFAAGILPGILLSVLFTLTVFFVVWVDPRKGPPGPRTSFRQKVSALSGITEMVFIFVFIMLGLFAGLFTPTEAGAIGAAFTLILGSIRERISWRSFWLAVEDTLRISCMVMMIVAGATIFGHFLAVTRLAYTLAETVSGLPLPAWGIMSLIIAIFFIGGCFMDAFGMILLTIPVFFPLVLKLGFDPIWFGVVVVLITEMGVITPPVGINVYVVGGVAKEIPLEVIFRGVIPFIVALVVCTIILLAFPQIALFLPTFLH